MFVRPTLFLLASSLSLNFAAAQVVIPADTKFGHITALKTGHIATTVLIFNGGPVPIWFREPAETMSVSLDVPFVNSSEPGLTNIPCKITNAGYALDPKDPGVKVHEAVLLGAFLAGKKVRLSVEGCIYDKPRIFAVDIGEALD
jgi:hypothetical protein